MTKMNHERTTYCEECNAMRKRCQHPYPERDLSPDPPPSLPPGWSATASTEQEIEELRKQQEL